MNSFMEKNQTVIGKLIVLVGALLALFLFAATLGKLKEYRFIGSGVTAGQTITVTGKGEIDRAPDTAKISFSVRAEDKLVKNAQTTVSQKIDAITAALQNLGIEERHIKTDSYNSYPKYETIPPCYSSFCPNQTPKIIGYEVSHMVTVSVKDLDNVENVLGALGTAGVSDLNGPNFGFEDDEAVQREARDLAIEDAREQAKVLARSLGVKIVRLANYSEGVSYPYAAVRNQAFDAKEMAGAAMPAPSIPVGDQNITSQVTLTYEIR